mmetsp:Transcript_34885/g.62347  ORF Transcript_34885/g.62347 Transcript_34885/m.62347 type:complete len:284 (+) Transcript_34885:283-1134(+)
MEVDALKRPPATISDPAPQGLKLVQLVGDHPKWGFLALLGERVRRIGVRHVRQQVRERSRADQDLPTCAQAADPGSVVDVPPVVVGALGDGVRLPTGDPGVEAHADPHALEHDFLPRVVVLHPGRHLLVKVFGPVELEQLVLDIDTVHGGGLGGGERHHESVPLRLHLETLVLLDQRSHCIVMHDQGFAHALFVSLPQDSAALDIREDQRHTSQRPLPGVLQLILVILLFGVDDPELAQHPREQQHHEHAGHGAPGGDDEAAQDLQPHLGPIGGTDATVRGPF